MERCFTLGYFLDTRCLIVCREVVFSENELCCLQLKLCGTAVGECSVLGPCCSDRQLKECFRVLPSSDLAMVVNIFNLSGKKTNSFYLEEKLLNMFLMQCRCVAGFHSVDS